MSLRPGLLAGMLLSGILRAGETCDRVFDPGPGGFAPTVMTEGVSDRCSGFTMLDSALRLVQQNDVARIAGQIAMPSDGQFLLIAPPTLAPVPGADLARNWRVQPGPISLGDSSRYVGIGVEASRAFKVAINIYTNLGLFVNKIEFVVPQAEFDKLSKGVKNQNRVLRVLWDNRARDGSLAGTGAYILRTDVTLLKVPGLAENQVVRSDYRVVGLLRTQ